MTDYEPVNVDFIRSYDPDPETDSTAVAEAVALINAAKRPLVLVGQGVELGNAQKELQNFVEKADIPCGCTLLGLSALPSNHRLNKGMLGMHGNLGPNVKTNECDVLIAVGMRFDGKTGNIRQTGQNNSFRCRPFGNRKECGSRCTGARKLQTHLVFTY